MEAKKEAKGKKTGLIMEGGAMRGMFTSGVLDVLMEQDIRFDGAIGVSAGAVFGCNYKSHQIGSGIINDSAGTGDIQASGPCLRPEIFMGRNSVIMRFPRSWTCLMRKHSGKIRWSFMWSARMF